MLSRWSDDDPIRELLEDSGIELPAGYYCQRSGKGVHNIVNVHVNVNK